MSSFDWLELEHITTDTDLLRDQLIEARSRQATARVRALEEEIARSEERRDKLLAHLTINMINDAEIRTHGRSRLPAGHVQPEPTAGADQAAPVVHARPEEAARADYNDETSGAVVDETSGTLTSASTGRATGAKEWRDNRAPNEEHSPQLTSLEMLVKEIDICRVRLAVAKLRKEPNLISRLEQEITAGEVRRKELMAPAAPEAGASTETHDRQDTIENLVPEDETRQAPEHLPPRPERSLDDREDTISSNEKSGDEDTSSYLEQATDDDDCDRTLASDRELLAEEVESTPPPPLETAVVTSDADASSNNSASVERPLQAEVEDERPLFESDDHTAVTNTFPSTIDPKVDNPGREAIMWNNSELELAKKEIESRCDEMFERHRQELEAMLAKQADEVRRLQNDREELEALQQAIGAALRKFKAPAADAGVTRLEDERVSRLQGLS